MKSNGVNFIKMKTLKTYQLHLNKLDVINKKSGWTLIGWSKKFEIDYTAFKESVA